MASSGTARESKENRFSFLAFFYCNSFSATRLALAVLAKLSQSELWIHVWSRSRSWSHSLRESVTQSVSWAQSSLPCPSVCPPSQSVNMHGKCLAYTCSHAQRSSRRCCLQNSHVRFIGRLDTGQWDSVTEREINDSHTAKTAITIFIRLVVDVRGHSLSCPLNATNLPR